MEKSLNKKYHHLKEQDRIFLRIMLEKRYPKTKIGKILGIDRSTIHREIKRNSCTHWYSKKQCYDNFSAHKKYLNRRKRTIKLEINKDLRFYIHNKLQYGWSPWQIEGRLKLENQGQCIISHETIYRYIYSDYGIRNRFYSKLRRKHFLRVKRGTRKPRVPNDMLISTRSEAINARKEFGHWECDLMMFKQGIRANLITLRERKSRFMVAIKNQNKSASSTALVLINTVKRLKDHIRSITFDQGTEFNKYTWIKDCIETDIYFCDPASPYQKGGVENGNGIIRVELPRDKNIEILKQAHISRIVNEINNRPLKCLDYLTPNEIFNAYINNTVLS